MNLVYKNTYKYISVYIVQYTSIHVVLITSRITITYQECIRKSTVVTVYTGERAL